MKNIIHPFVFWNDVNNRVIREIINEDGYLNVIASCEKTNPVDSKSVIILLNVETLVSRISGTPVNLNDSQGVIVKGFIRIGYLQWQGWEKKKAEIYDFLTTRKGLSILGNLVPDGEHGALKFESLGDDNQ